MELKGYQKTVISDLSRYLELLQETQSLKNAYSQFWNEKGVIVGFGGVKPYQNRLPGVPNVCMKVPTGGGKTFIAANSVKPIFDALPEAKAKVVVWLVPSDAILSQTLSALKDTGHPYRQKLDVDFGSRVQVYTKEQLLNGQNFNPTAVTEQLSVCVLSYDSFRGRKENLKARQENSSLVEFSKVLGAPENPIEDADESALLQVINQLSPLVIVDESHHAKSALSIKMLKDFNPCFILELTATPKDESNIICYVDALQLKRENMVKLPVIVYNRDNQGQVLSDAIDLRRKLEEVATHEQKATGRYIRPIALFQAQPRGKEDSTTFEKLRDRLVETGIPAEHIAIRTADVNELKNVDLMSENCPIRYIITVNALKEGWDCPFAYILASLANKTSKIDVEQILGRILRLPHTRKNPTLALNMSYVLTSSNDFNATLSSIVTGLNSAGFSEKDCRIATEPPTAKQPEQHPVQQSFDDAQPEAEEEFLDFDPASVAQALSEQPQENAARAADIMLAGAATVGEAYEESVNAHSDPAAEELSWEVRDKMPTYPVKQEFREEIEKLLLPQFVHVIPQSIFSDGHFELLEKETLSEGFTLKGKPTSIDFTGADTQMVQVDVNEEDGGMPRVYKLDDPAQEYFKKYFSKLPQKDRIERCKEIMHKQLNRLNTVDAGELKQYVDRVVEDMNEDQLAALEKSPLSFAKLIEDRIGSLLEEHYEKQFSLWLETGKIQCQPLYAFPEYIHPVESTTMYGCSLYTAEEEPDTSLEKDLIVELTGVSSVKWWHRNMARHGFRINGFINHYPDIIIMTQRGTIVLAETKGAHLKNAESLQKVRLGRAWQNKANKDGDHYRYYMVFKDSEDHVDGMISQSEFLSILKNL